MTSRYCLIRREIVAPTGVLTRATHWGNVPSRTTGRTPWTRPLASAEKSSALLLLSPRQRVYNPWQGRRTQIQTA